MPPRSAALERVAEVHFFIRPVLERALSQQVITDEGRKFIQQPWSNYLELWNGTFADRFFDMTTMVRLGGAIEEELRNVYMRKKSHANIAALKADPDYTNGTFQRIMPWQKGKQHAHHTLASVGYDLFTNSQIASAQRVMLHRHLYAHNLGAVDADYLDKWQRLAGEDLMPTLTPMNYPAVDTYWFRPLGEITQFITDLRTFMNELPA